MCTTNIAQHEHTAHYYYTTFSYQKHYFYCLLVNDSHFTEMRLRYSNRTVNSSQEILNKTAALEHNLNFDDTNLSIIGLIFKHHSKSKKCNCSSLNVCIM